MDLDLKHIGADILFTDDLTLNAEHILFAYKGEFKNYAELGLGRYTFNHSKVVDENLIKSALAYDGIDVASIDLQSIKTKLNLDD